MDLSLKFELSFHCLGPLKIPPAWQWNHCCGSAECRQCCGPLGRKHRRWYRGLLIPLFLALAFNVRCADRIIVPGAARDCDSQYPCSTGGSLGEILANIKQHLTICTSINMILLSPCPYSYPLPKQNYCQIGVINQKSFTLGRFQIVEVIGRKGYWQ